MTSKTSVIDALQAAVASHQAGDLSKAKRLYRKVLKQQPDQPDALNLLGVIAHHDGDLDEAVALYDQAMAAAPALATLPFNKGNALRDAERLPEAHAAYEAALAIDPGFHDARLNLGVLLQENDDTDQALKHFLALINLAPKNHPNIQKAHYNIGKCRQAQGRLEEAQAELSTALTLNPNDHNAHFALANVYADMNQHTPAIDSINTAIKLNPNWSEAYSILGLVLSRIERFDEAIAASKKAVELNPQSGAVHVNLALVYTACGDKSAAEASLQKAQSSTDANAEAKIALANMSKDNLDPWGALALLEQALEFSPSALVLNNIGAMFRDLDLNSIALTFYQTAYQTDPDLVEAVRSLGYLKLRIGELEEGWKINQQRLDDQNFKRNRMGHPSFWRGEDLSSKKLHIFLEEGIGDQILQASLIGEMLEKTKACTIECADRLAPIVRRTFPNVTVIEDQSIPVIGSALEQSDFQCPALELGYHLRKTFKDFPSHRPSYLKPDPELTERYKKKYRDLAKGKKIVGLSWSSSSPGYGKYKTLDLDAMQPILESEDAFFVSLQYGDVSPEIEVFQDTSGIRVHLDDSVDQLRDLETFFAQVAAMDMVITISSTTAHVAGATGTPAWVMLPRGAGSLWYWFMDRTDSPWYPSLRLFRQKNLPTLDKPWWPEVIDEVSRKFPKWLTRPSS